MPPKLFVAGGSGFIGSTVCQCADAQDYEVISLSRRGRPDLSAAWVERVQWTSASVFDVERWQDHLQGCAAIVYCIGIILERPDQQATYQRINTEAAISVADAAVSAQVGALVHISVSGKPPLSLRPTSQASAAPKSACNPIRFARLFCGRGRCTGRAGRGPIS